MIITFVPTRLYLTNFVIGGMAEWSKAADLRSVGRLSARVRTSLPSYFFLNFPLNLLIWSSLAGDFVLQPGSMEGRACTAFMLQHNFCSFRSTTHTLHTLVLEAFFILHTLNISTRGLESNSGNKLVAKRFYSYHEEPLELTFGKGTTK
jgi:hypothetical protein